jgi:hypothetical protein
MMINTTAVGILSADDQFSTVDRLRDAPDTASPEKIQHLLDLLGEAVLLAWPVRSKGSRRRWRHIGAANMKLNRRGILGGGRISTWEKRPRNGA